MREDGGGAHLSAPPTRYDNMGLGLLIHQGGEVVALDAMHATIRMPSGSVLVYLRQPRPGSITYWELVR